MINGVGHMPPRTQRGFAPLDHVPMPEDALRKLDHPEWLEDFAKVMQLNTGVEITPMRAGVISRCRMAADYIKLLRYDISKLKKELARTATALDRAMTVLEDNNLDRVLDQHDEGR